MSAPIDKDATLAVAHLYHNWITGLVLSLITRKSPALATEFVYRLFRRQHLERFIPGLKKLGLDQLPHAVAAAKYHYFSNQLGGVKVEYFEGSERKVWIRYPPPRWIWAGTAICAIPSQDNALQRNGWRFFAAVDNEPALVDIWRAPFDGLLSVHDRFLQLEHDHDDRFSVRDRSA